MSTEIFPLMRRGRFMSHPKFGRFLLANLERKGVDHSFVRRDASQPTGMSVAIFDDDGDYGAVIVSGSNLTLGEADVSAAQKCNGPINIRTRSPT